MKKYRRKEKIKERKKVKEKEAWLGNRKRNKVEKYRKEKIERMEWKRKTGEGK